jgi:predicted peroxiredoxin
VADARPPLLLIATTGDAERLRGALTIACTEAALGGSVRLFLLLDAVALLREPVAGPRDDVHAVHGLPSLVALIDDALDFGVRIIACQSGMALAGFDASELDPRIEPGGPVSALSATGANDRVVIA